MNAPLSKLGLPDPVYPETDGRPMAENTLQFQWIVTLKENLDLLFLHREDVFVAGDLLWYSVQGKPRIRQAPDALVVFGRPKGHRGSYQQWLEDGIPPQVVFEVLSPSNRAGELLRKRRFYQRYGVEEYYVWDPDRLTLEGWQRQKAQLQKLAAMNGWTSPRLGITFRLDHDGLRLLRPDGQPFLTFAELEQQRQQAELRADQEQQRADQEQQRAERLATQLRALGIEPEA